MPLLIFGNWVLSKIHPFFIGLEIYLLLFSLKKGFGEINFWQVVFMEKIKKNQGNLELIA